MVRKLCVGSHAIYLGLDSDLDSCQRNEIAIRQYGLEFRCPDAGTIFAVQQTSGVRLAWFWNFFTPNIYDPYVLLWQTQPALSSEIDRIDDGSEQELVEVLSQSAGTYFREYMCRSCGVKAFAFAIASEGVSFGYEHLGLRDLRKVKCLLCRQCGGINGFCPLKYFDH